MSAATQVVQGARRGRRPQTAQSSAAAGRLFWLLIVFLVLEYVRPSLISQLKIQMVLSLALPFACYQQLKNRPWDRILTLQLAFVALCALHVPLALNYYSAYFVTRILYGNVAIGLSMAWIFSDPKLLRRGMWCWLFIMTYVGLFGITHSGRGPGGFLGDENDLALACNTALPLAFFGFEWAKGGSRWVYGAVGAVLVVAVVASFSRGGFLGLAAAGLYCFIVSRHKVRNLMVVLVAALLFVSLAPQKYLDEIDSIRGEAAGEAEGGTGEARYFLWQSAFNMWKANPIIGVGGGNFNWWVGVYQPTDWVGIDYNDRNWTGQATHSVFLQLLSEQGALGIGIWGTMLTFHFLLMRRLRKMARTSRRMPPALQRDIEIYSGALSGAMVGFLASGAFLSVAYYPYAWYFPAIGIGLKTAVERSMASRGGTPPAGGKRGPRGPKPSLQRAMPPKPVIASDATPRTGDATSSEADRQEDSSAPSDSLPDASLSDLLTKRTRE